MGLSRMATTVATVVILAYDDWSSTYTVLSVLHQQQCFLFADRDTKIEQFCDGGATTPMGYFWGLEWMQ